MADPIPTQGPLTAAPRRQDLVFRVTAAERQATDAYVAYSVAVNTLPSNVRGPIADLVTSSGRPDAAQMGAYLLDVIATLAGRPSHGETFVRALAYVTNVVAEDLGAVFADVAVRVEVVPDGTSPLPRLVQVQTEAATQSPPVFVPPTPQGSPTPIGGQGSGQGGGQ